MQSSHGVDFAPGIPVSPSPSVAVLAPRILATGNAPLLIEAAGRSGRTAEIFDVQAVQAQVEQRTLTLDVGRIVRPEIIVVTDIPNTEYGKLLVVNDLCRMPTAPFVKSSTTWALASNKNDVSERLDSAGIPIPRSIRINSGDDAELFDAFSRLGGGQDKFVWLKDPLGSGGTGVKPVRGIAALLRASRALGFHQGIELQMQEDKAGIDALGHSFDFCVAIMGPKAEPFTYMRRESSPKHGVTSTSQGGTKRWVPTPPGFAEIARASLEAVGLDTGFVDISTPTADDIRVLEIGIDGNLNRQSFSGNTPIRTPDLARLAIEAAADAVEKNMERALAGARGGPSLCMQGKWLQR